MQCNRDTYTKNRIADEGFCFALVLGTNRILLLSIK